MQASDADAVRSKTLDQVREEFHRELMRKSMRIAELEIAIERNRLELESSWSWRLTRPLRIRSWIRRLGAGARERS